MGEQVKNTKNEMAERWHSKMPKFFYWIVVAACGIAGAAFTIHTTVPALGGTLPDWWYDIYTHILTTCISVVFVCKFTVAGGYKKINPDDLVGHINFSKDDTKDTKENDE